MISNGFIQIAGVIDQLEADLLIECGIKFIGFPLRLSVHEVDLSEEDAKQIISTFPDDVEGILITYLDQADEIIELANFLGVKYIQLHGAISTEELRNLKEIRKDFILIKSLVVGEYDEKQLQDIMAASIEFVDAFITDTFDPNTGASGATGKTHDWNISRKLIESSPLPVILAGGLNPENVIAAVESTQPIGVDSHTGVEGSDGRKDLQKVRLFIEKSTQALKKKTIKPTGPLIVGYLSKHIQNKYKGTDTENICLPELTIDLTDVNYIEMPVLIYLLSLISQRENKNLITKILLPQKKDIRDYLRLWNFPNALKDTTSTAFKNFCTPEDINNYFGENKSNKKGTKYSESRSDAKEQFVNKNCFSIYTRNLTRINDKNEMEPLTKEQKTDLVSEIANQWKDPEVQNKLYTFFRNESCIDSTLTPSLISYRIVYEAISNALRHPNAKILAWSSSIDKTYKKANALLTLSYWDDGQSFYDTIYKALSSGKEITCTVNEEDYFTYDVEHHDDRGLINHFSFESNRLIATSSNNIELFLSCLSPGVSCDIGRKNYIENLEDDIETSPPGWGLYVLLNCACEIYNGAVIIQSGGLYAHITASEDINKHRFNVKVKETEYCSPAFNGNMITVRLPLS